ncbi:MAG: DNA replication and repair protein RecF [Bacteroidota bacterium]|jgi:DNA replication and repair protein RecF
MKLKNISIKNLRNHKQTDLVFNGGLNLFLGLNGAGKTTILEAISIGGFSKSFLPSSDSSLISNGENFYRVGINAINELDVAYKVAVRYTPGEKKQINSSFGDNLSAKDIIGEIPLIVLSPDFKTITFGAPQDRREFIDRILCQASKVYIEELYNLRRVLKQRNNLLAIARQDRYFNFAELEPWTELFIKSCSEIFIRRFRFIKDFVPIFNQIYPEIAGDLECVNIEYLPNGFSQKIIEDGYTKENLLELYKDLSKKLIDDEVRRGLTLFGSQKDEIRISINSGIAKEYASQGQHKSLLISLKFAEYFFLKEKKNDTPVILLDDIFSELDKKRTEKVFDLILKNQCQTFITSTEEEEMKRLLSGLSNCSFYRIDNGFVISE